MVQNKNAVKLRERESRLGIESGERQNWEICPPTASRINTPGPATSRINNAFDGFLFFLWLFFFHKFKVKLVLLYVFKFYNCSWIFVLEIRVKEIGIMICDYFCKIFSVIGLFEFFSFGFKSFNFFLCRNEVESINNLESLI